MSGFDIGDFHKFMGYISNPQYQSLYKTLISTPPPGRQRPQALLRALPGPPARAAAADAADELPRGATGEDHVATGESTGDGVVFWGWGMGFGWFWRNGGMGKMMWLMLDVGDI